MADDDTMQPLVQGGGTKVDEQPNGYARQLQAGHELPGVDRCQSLHGLDFHDDPVLDEEIRAESFLEHHLLVLETDWFLSLDLKAALFECARQHRLVDDSNSPGPRSRWRRTEASTIAPVMSLLA